MNNASGLEIVYVLIVLVGCLCNAWCLRDAVEDRRAVLRRYMDGELDALITTSNMSLEIVLLMVQSSFLALGILAIFLPPSQPEELQTWVVLARLWFLVAAVSVAIWSFSNLRRRRRLLEIPDRSEQAIDRAADKIAAAIETAAEKTVEKLEK